MQIIPSQKGLSAFWRTELKFIMIFVDGRNYVKSNKMKFSKYKWLEKGKIKYTNTEVSSFGTML